MKVILIVVLCALVVSGRTDEDPCALGNRLPSNLNLPKGGPFVNASQFPKNGNPDCYCWVDVVAKDDGEVVFKGDAPCALPDPKFMVKGGETNRVILLIGKMYAASAKSKISVAGVSDDSIKVLVKDDKTIRVHWPVVISAILDEGE